MNQYPARIVHKRGSGFAHCLYSQQYIKSPDPTILRIGSGLSQLGHGVEEPLVHGSMFVSQVGMMEMTRRLPILGVSEQSANAQMRCVPVVPRAATLRSSATSTDARNCVLDASVCRTDARKGKER